jgi:hypothetical protein
VARTGELHELVKAINSLAQAKRTIDRLHRSQDFKDQFESYLEYPLEMLLAETDKLRKELAYYTE